MSEVYCVICGNKEGWVNVDEYRFKPHNMCMCPKCGMVTYPDIIAKSDELKEFYRKEYRPGPSVNNDYTGQRKLHYHAHFLDEVFSKWVKEGKKPEVFEVGAAYGLFLKMVRDAVPGAVVGGTELTTSFRNVAWNINKIRLVEEFDDSKKYDLIASYKVAEHIPFIDKEIRRYALALKDDGHLYISVPTWFHTMTNFGAGGFDIESYYDTNHINVWTRPLFETLLKKCGLEVVKVNYVYYDATYLCKRNDEMMKVEPKHEEPTTILNHLSNIKKAALAMDDGKPEEAIKHFASFPSAVIASYEKNRGSWDKRGFEAIEGELIPAMRKACPESIEVLFLCADIYMRYDRFEKALEYLQECLRNKPEDPGTLMAVGHCYRAIAARSKSPEDATKLYTQAMKAMQHLRMVSLQFTADATTWMYADAAKIPIEEAHG